jgi:hypothetical protein
MMRDILCAAIGTAIIAAVGFQFLGVEFLTVVSLPMLLGFVAARCLVSVWGGR